MMFFQFMEPVTAIAIISGASVAATQLGIHGPGIKRMLDSQFASWKTYGKWFSQTGNPYACQCISTWLLSQQHQITGSTVELSYVYENKEAGVNFRYMFSIPQFNKPFMMKCLFGIIFIVPRSLNGDTLCGYYVYTECRGWATGWKQSEEKINMLDFFLNDLFQTAKFKPLKKQDIPPVIYPVAYAQFPEDYHQFLYNEKDNKLSTSRSYDINPAERARKTQTKTDVVKNPDQPYQQRMNPNNFIRPRVDYPYSFPERCTRRRLTTEFESPPRRHTIHPISSGKMDATAVLSAPA